MELSPVCRRGNHARRVLVALLATVFGALLLITVVPSMLGMTTQVIRSDDSTTGLDRGTVVIAKPMPTGDIQVGDLVIAGPSDDHPMRLVTAATPGRLVTAEEPGATFPVVTVDQPTTDVAQVRVPYVGLPIAALSPVGRGVLLVVVGSALAVVAMAGRPRLPTRRTSDREASRASLV